MGIFDSLSSLLKGFLLHLETLWFPLCAVISSPWAELVDGDGRSRWGFLMSPPPLLPPHHVLIKSSPSERVDVRSGLAGF